MKKGFAKIGVPNVRLDTGSHKPNQKPIYGSTPKASIAPATKALAGTRKTHILGLRPK